MRPCKIVHAGLYYAPSTLKAELCVAGARALYSLCERQSIPYAKPGKLIVAQNESQRKALDPLHETAKMLSVPTEFLSSSQVSAIDPEVRAAEGALLSPETGIFDSHAFMNYLLSSFSDTGGDLALASTISSVTHSPARGWTITVHNATTGSTETITAETVINSAGLSAFAIANLVLPADRQFTPRYAKGSYWSYASRAPRTKHLIYPAPQHGLGGLGTHLTLDLRGRIRFGPDVEWTDDPSDYTPNDDPARREAAVKEIKAYLPAIDESKLQIDYCGIRPKLVGKGEGNQDFYIVKEDGLEGFVNLLGIESPGLTASLAIGDKVHDLLYR